MKTVLGAKYVVSFKLLELEMNPSCIMTRTPAHDTFEGKEMQSRLAGSSYWQPSFDKVKRCPSLYIW